MMIETGFEIQKSENTAEQYIFYPATKQLVKKDLMRMVHRGRTYDIVDIGWYTVCIEEISIEEYNEAARKAGRKEISKEDYDEMVSTIGKDYDEMVSTIGKDENNGVSEIEHMKAKKQETIEAIEEIAEDEKDFVKWDIVPFAINLAFFSTIWFLPFWIVSNIVKDSGLLRYAIIPLLIICLPLFLYLAIRALICLIKMERVRHRYNKELIGGKL